MSPEQIVDTIIRLNLKVTPVLGEKDKVLYWTAGIRHCSGGYTNIVLIEEHAKGKTLQEAVVNLLSMIGELPDD